MSIVHIYELENTLHDLVKNFILEQFPMTQENVNKQVEAAPVIENFVKYLNDYIPAA